MSSFAIDRRDALRGGLLALAALGGAGALTACSDDAGPSGGSTGGTSTGDIELVSSGVTRAAGDPTLLPAVVAGLDDFTAALYGELVAVPGNLVLSPYSVLIALGMTLGGAAGTTAEEMGDVLGVGDLADRWHKGVNALTAAVDGLAGEQERADGSSAELAVATANQLFGQRDVAWEEGFLDLLAKEYGAAMRAVDFREETEESRLLINGWVEEQTNDRIVDLVPEGILDPSTRLVLVNAIYLKAPWETPFEEELTVTGPFRTLDDATVQAELMRQPLADAALATGDGWRSARLPYAGRALAMTVVLPDEGRFADVERSLAAAGPATFLAGAAPAMLDLTLPRWTFRTEVPLKEVLSAIGMPTAFARGADFTPMTEEDLDLVIAEVLHQGFIAVDEEGTEAAAATAVVMAETSAPLTEPFLVDRPFLFVIHDVEHGTPLFVGRVVDPTA